MGRPDVTRRVRARRAVPCRAVSVVSACRVVSYRAACSGAERKRNERGREPKARAHVDASSGSTANGLAKILNESKDPACVLSLVVTRHGGGSISEPVYFHVRRGVWERPAASPSGNGRSYGQTRPRRVVVRTTGDIRKREREEKTRDRSAPGVSQTLNGEGGVKIQPPPPLIEKHIYIILAFHPRENFFTCNIICISRNSLSKRV